LDFIVADVDVSMVIRIDVQELHGLLANACHAFLYAVAALLVNKRDIRLINDC